MMYAGHETQIITPARSSDRTRDSRGSEACAFDRSSQARGQVHCVFGGDGPGIDRATLLGLPQTQDQRVAGRRTDDAGAGIIPPAISDFARGLA